MKRGIRTRDHILGNPLVPERHRHLKVEPSSNENARVGGLGPKMGAYG